MNYVNVPQEDWSLGMAAVVHLCQLIKAGCPLARDQYHCFYCSADLDMGGHKSDCPYVAAKSLLDSTDVPSQLAIEY